jgi:hypothetical protein
MKNILKLMFGMLLFCAAAFSQESSKYDYKIPYAETSVTWPAVSQTTNATTATDSVWFYTIYKESSMPVKYDFKVSCDSVGGTYKRVPIVLKAKKFLSDDWTTVTTVAWTTGKDTVKTFTQSTTAQQYQYWQIYIKSDSKGFIFKIPELSAKFWEQ